LALLCFLSFFLVQQANSGKDATNNSSSSASDYSKKEEFRRYLEKTGVLDALTKVLVGLYEEPERPTHAIEYIKRYVGAPQNVDVEGLKRENEQLRAELDRLKRQQNNNSSNAKSNISSKGNNNSSSSNQSNNNNATSS
jgi:hypothetical protein